MYNKTHHTMNLYFKSGLFLLFTVFLFSCNSEPVELADHDWKVTDLSGSPASKSELAKLSLEFKDGKEIGGFAGCNDYRGGATYNEEQIQFSTLYTDNRSCKLKQLEKRFLSNLESSKQYSYYAGKLILQDESGNILVELEQL
ncbi:META domain-containing protein [Cyclobacterium sediminis]